jgi:ribosomal-protein-alanine N-acetyltransferase
MDELKLRYQQVGDAKRFFKILTHPDFKLFPVTVKSIEEEKRFLRTNRQLRAKNLAYNYAILLYDRIVGGIGLRIDQHRPYIGEVGYFVAREYWGKGIAPKAVGMIEEIGFNQHDLERIELVTLKANKASMRVAEKCGYKKEGIQRHKQLHDGTYQDVYLFAKVKPDCKNSSIEKMRSQEF